jgi:5S rRNA maturation endonuclease (ribonuclease M5)
VNRELRFKIAGKALAEARSANRSGATILVEGKRDRSILENLGFSGGIILLNRGWPIERVVVNLIEHHSRNPIILMDWDRTGGRLQKEITNRLQSLDVLIDPEPRRTLSKALRPETLCVEGMRTFILDLLPIVDLNDPEGADEPYLL